MQNFQKLIQLMNDSELIFNRLGYTDQMKNESFGELFVQVEVNEDQSFFDKLLVQLLFLFLRFYLNKFWKMLRKLN